MKVEMIKKKKKKKKKGNEKGQEQLETFLLFFKKWTFKEKSHFH